jgi:5-methylcytosine-specific restriction endonuclease McrA
MATARRNRIKQMPRVIIPARSTGQPARASYRAYKPQLRVDFAQCCGYCGDEDRFYGGLPGYQVDHFAPHSLFPALLTAYANLVYACPYCNRGKSNTWIGVDAAVSHNGEEGFVDPCLPAFDEPR